MLLSLECRYWWSLVFIYPIVSVLANPKFYAPQFKYFLKDPVKYDVKYQVFFHFPTQTGLWIKKKRFVITLSVYFDWQRHYANEIKYDDFIIPNMMISLA